MSDEARDLIEKLLTKDVAKRLGTRTGANEIKAHPWWVGGRGSCVRCGLAAAAVPRAQFLQQVKQQQE